MKYNFEITSDKIRGIPVINIQGDLTFDADGALKKEFSDILDNNPSGNIIMNFEMTKYINSSGIATLISIIQDSNEKNIKISFVGMSTHFQKVMDIVGIIDFIEIYNTNEEALAVFNE
ncbi:STAS domain-containing protein [Spirochaetota bacterium]